MHSFEPHAFLHNPHAQTLASSLWPRRFPRLPPSVAREFETEPGTRIRGECHWQAAPRERPTLVLVHGLEGSSRSGYMLGLAQRAVEAGWNAVRLNQRNCGGTESLTPTLYNSGLSGDYRAVLMELIERDALTAIFFAGYSMGGNLVLKMAGELGEEAPRELRGVAAVCPCIDLALCADAVALPGNFIYQRHFVGRLKERMRRKARLFPGKFNLGPMARARTLRDFDDIVTATYCGFRDASDYYARSSALRVTAHIRVPAFILTAQDDPFVPFASFSDPAVAGNAHIQLCTPQRGGHCAFISRYAGGARYWAEARLMDFFTSHDSPVTNHSPSGGLELQSRP
ncbi:MAG TPA: alpha/beta fold hydrolase [Candidatus Dormibacteraeota bacterium]|nr:alpha/beta fold hydrolase [Candidatus Dormibacteraeota bacterium]